MVVNGSWVVNGGLIASASTHSTQACAGQLRVENQEGWEPS